jgi:hypothetical protein
MTAAVNIVPITAFNSGLIPLRSEAINEGYHFPGVDPNETDPLVIITAGLRANAEAVKEGTAEAKATRREVAASDRRTEQQLETLKKYVLDNTTAIEMFTRSEQLLANAEIAKYWWGVGGFVAGVVVLEAGQLLWLHFFG